MKKMWVLFCLAVLLAALQASAPEAAVPADVYTPLHDSSKYVALTFDDGPHPVTTPQLLDGLAQRGVNATFFLVGSQIAGNEALIRRMAREEHQIGNHTWNHQRLETAEPVAFQAEIQQVDAALRQLLGPEDYWLRPPYGQISAEQLKQVAVPLVKWSVDPRDWESRNAEAIVSAVLDSIQSGSIILLHDIYPSSVEAALTLIDRLQQEGYVFVTVQELLSLYQIPAEPGVMYRAATGQIVSYGT